MKRFICIAAAGFVVFSTTLTAGPVTLLFSTGSPDGKIATLSRLPSGALLETETADDFVLGQSAFISNATFTGLLLTGAALSSITGIEIELDHVFPGDSTNPPDGRVLTRANSPSDNQFAAFDSKAGSLTFSATVLNQSFTAANSVVNGINAIPNQFTGGEGAATGEEVQFNITFTTPFFVNASDHDFFRPEVGLTNGNFLWLSAPKPITSPGTPFNFQGAQPPICKAGSAMMVRDRWHRIGSALARMLLIRIRVHSTRRFLCQEQPFRNPRD